MTLNLNRVSDETMILAAQRDSAEFRALYDKYVDKIFQFIYYRMNHDRSQAYDLTAEVFTRALQHISTFKWQGYPYSSYLYKIARFIYAKYVGGPVTLWRKNNGEWKSILKSKYVWFLELNY